MTNSRKIADEKSILEHIQRFALVMLGNYHDACDLVQEVFLELEKGRNKWEQAESARAWALGVFHRQLQRFLRLRARRKAELLPEEVQLRQPSFENKIMVDEQLKRTFAAIQLLPKELAESLLLFAVEEMSIKEIASLQNVAEGTVKWRIFEARRRISANVGEANEV